MEHFLECINCKARYDPEEIMYTCEKCGDLLEVKYDYTKISRSFREEDWFSRPLNVWRYRELLPIRDPSKIVSLQEGGTSLQHCNRLGSELKLKCVFVKNEGENPTGSFKDRGMTVGVTKAIELGSKIVACASTGNTSASLAAYAAKAGLTSIVFIPSGKIALGKLTQAMIHGANIVQIKGSFDDALKTMISFTESHREVYLLNSINPYRIEGQKTLAYEIYNQLEGIGPDTVILPVGNAGNISAIWKGFVDLQRLGILKHLPRMVGIQAENAAPITTAFKHQENKIQPLEQPETVATAIRIGAPVSWKKALNAVYDSKGLMETVSDNEILEAQKLIARLEGLFIEPASAASIAGLKKLIRMGLIDSDERIVCVATGHGLKDPNIVLSTYERPLEVDTKEELIKRILTV
ncbi:MAG: threonine synthase [Candidatus Bathyarchaeota archaeon]